jgi:nucleoside-diphosphate-sugar epimerase
MVRALVIGGTHFVGRHIVELLLEHGHEVAVLNRGQSFDPLSAKVERLRADRTRPDEFLGALQGRSFDSVVDCVGYKKEEMQTLVDRFRGRVKRYVFISSVSVYRPAGILPIEESHPVQRDSQWAYPTQKVECENALEDAGREFGFPWVSLRPAYVYGPYNSNPTAESRFFARIEQGGTVPIPGSGDFVFHQTHARDLARATLAAIERQEAVGKIYNIAGAFAQTATRFVQAIGEAMGQDVDIAYARHITRRRDAAPFFFYQTRPTQIYSIQRARRDLAWEPQFDIVAGLRDAYAWFTESDYMATHEYDFSADDAVLSDLRDRKEKDQDA